MRIAVLLVGILGSLGAGALAGLTLLTLQGSEVAFQLLTQRTPQQAVTEGIDPMGLAPGWTMTTAQEWLDGHHWQALSVWFLLGAAVLGLAGSFLGLARRGFSAAVLLLAAFAAPLVVYPGVLTALFPSLLAVAAVLALFVRPSQRAAGAEEAQ